MQHADQKRFPLENFHIDLLQGVRPRESRAFVSNPLKHSDPNKRPKTDSDLQLIHLIKSHNRLHNETDEGFINIPYRFVTIYERKVSGPHPTINDDEP